MRNQLESHFTDSLLDRQIRQFVSEMEASSSLMPQAGIAISVVQGPKVLYQGTFGLRDRENQLPVTQQTIFAISSVTKTFTAAALMMAQEEGHIDLNAPINSSRPILPLKDPTVSRHVSVADILSHRTGMPNHDVIWYFGPDQVELLAEKLRHLDLIPQGFRKTFVYNNFLFGCLGIVFKEVLGESWESYIHRKLLAPLGIKTSGKDIALPYSGVQAIKRKESPSVVSANGMGVSIEGMTTWMQFHLNQGETIQKVQLMSRESIQNMQSPQIPVKEVSPLISQGMEWLREDKEYGYGWFLSKVNGTKVVYHAGISDGYSTAVLLLPELSLGFTVLMNQNLSPIPGELIQRLVELYFGKKAATTTSSQSSPSPSASGKATESRSVPASISSIEGVYSDPAYGTIQAVQTMEGIILKYNGYEWPLILHEADNATVMMTALAKPLPVPAKLEIKDGKVESILIPLSFDPRVAAQKFSRI